LTLEVRSTHLESYRDLGRSARRLFSALKGSRRGTGVRLALLAWSSTFGVVDLTDARIIVWRRQSNREMPHGLPYASRKPHSAEKRLVGGRDSLKTTGLTLGSSVIEAAFQPLCERVNLIAYVTASTKNS
jgi:hypothetical protein